MPHRQPDVLSPILTTCTLNLTISYTTTARLREALPCLLHPFICWRKPPHFDVLTSSSGVPIILRTDDDPQLQRLYKPSGIQLPPR